MTNPSQRAAPRIYDILSWLVTVLVPVALVLTSVRLMFMDSYLQLEYNAKGFPADRYGFTTQDRLYWSKIARDYLLNSSDISFLGDLRFQDDTSVYNQRELGHMVDVKNTVSAAFSVWYASLILLAGLGVWAWLGKWGRQYKRGLGRGGWLTVILLGSIILLVLLSFGILFVAFHNVFFDAGTWTFEFSDTLIRLFPERFWRDIFLAVGVLSAIGGLILGFLFGRQKRIPELSKK
jgi:integral membrane protein (TIGR01906 family)